jgi:transposase
MFIREKSTRNGQLLQLVRSVRTPDGRVRQELVASLGGIRIPAHLRREVAAAVENRLDCAQAQDLFPLPLDVAGHVDEILRRVNPPAPKPSRCSGRTPGAAPPPPCDPFIDGVLVDQVSHCRDTMLGPLLPLEAAWKALGLEGFLQRQGFSRSQINASKACVYNRLSDPTSENGLQDWVATTSLPDLLCDRFDLTGRDRYYRAGDKLLGCKAKLEKHLAAREAAEFSLSRSILLYDLTNSYFEGQAESNSLAARSMNSKENRKGYPLVALGMVLDADGFPLCHKVFAGNVHDCKTLGGIVAELRKLSGIQKAPTVVVDSGIASDENLGCLLARGYDYIVSGKRQSRGEFYDDFLEAGGFHGIAGRDPKRAVSVRRVARGAEQIVLCRSEARKLKEDAMVSKAEVKFLEEIEKLRQRIERGDSRLGLEKGDVGVNRVIGRICAGNTRASKFYDVRYSGAEGRVLTWRRKDREYEEAMELNGCYFLRTNRMDLTDDELWRIYMSLSRIEAGWRDMKSDLGLRPFYHQTAERCEAHILITVLAFHLQRWVERKMEMAGHPATFRSMRRLLQTHCYSTISLPTRDGKVHTLRKPGAPDERQAAVYQTLGIDLAALPTTRTTAILDDGGKKSSVVPF